MRTIIAKTLNNLSLILFILTPVLLIGAFLLSTFEGTTEFWQTWGVIRYPLYATAVTAMWAFLFMLLRNSRDGRGSVLLVALFHMEGVFAITLWGISIIALLMTTGLSNPYLLVLSRNLVTASAGVALVCVAMVYAAWRTGLLEMRVRAWPWRWSRKDRRVR